MKKWLKITLISLDSLIGVLLIVVAVALWLVFTPSQLTKIVNRLATNYVNCETHFGKVNLTLFKTFPDRAELTVRQTDFWFNRRWPEKPRPKNWRERVIRHDGRTITFWYDKPSNFYKG